VIHRTVRLKHDPRSEAIWLTVYADLITNMALVFLALFGLTIMGDDAVARAVQSMKLETLMEHATAPRNMDDLGPVLQQEFKGVPGITVTDGIGVVRIAFGEQILFDSGSASLKNLSHVPLERVAALLKNIPQTVVVEGHTDSVPLLGRGRYKNNWELSLARSMEVVAFLSQKLPEDQLAAAAYGETRPKASNATPGGRRENRRVEIALFRNFPYPPAASPKAAMAPAGDSSL
jgi:chemotaxis protein MotB